MTHRAGGRGTAIAVAAAAAILLLPPLPAAHASRAQESIFQDDFALVLSGAAKRERTLDDLAILGVDTVHSIVYWNRIAPAAGSRRRPAGFNGADPGAYPPEMWDRYDDLVRGAVARRLDVLLSPGAPIPAWASECRGSLVKLRTCKPNPTQFKRFVTALARRYSGSYADENQGGGVLPRVSRWSVWNEPNQGGWLTPQYERRGGRDVPSSPARYRGLFNAMAKALRSTGHASDDLLLGETAPLGRVFGSRSSRPIPPGDFLRAVLCIDNRGRALRGRAAAAHDCSRPRRLTATGMAHHPYTRGGSQPPTARSSANEITISSVSRLKKILAQASARGRIRRNLPIYYTEFGFQTNPPDRLFGVSLGRQAAYLNQADWLAFNDPRIRAVAQYELRDEPNLSAFQTGLRFADGREKPSFRAYQVPIWVVRRGSNVRIFGQIRPAEDDATETVLVRARRSSGEWETVRTITVTSHKGHFVTSASGRSGPWRLEWTPADGGPTLVSREAFAAPR